MSALVEKLRVAGNGVIEREANIEYIIGHPHPLWEQMCDVVDAANKLEWRLQRRQSLYTARLRLDKALTALDEALT